jgi:hypothetical protein
MLSVKRVHVAILAALLLVTGSTVAWLVYSGSLPKKIPQRAKQVFASQRADHFSSSQTGEAGIKLPDACTLKKER